MPRRAFKFYQRKRVVNINVNVFVAGLLSIALAKYPVMLVSAMIGHEHKFIISIAAYVIDTTIDVVLYFGLHWIANHWRPLKPRTPEDECDLCADKGSFWKTATFIQAERYLLSPIFYLVAMGGMWLLRHNTDLAVKWAFVISFTAAILTTRVIHTMWGLRTGRFR